MLLFLGKKEGKNAFNYKLRRVLTYFNKEEGNKYISIGQKVNTFF